MTFFKPNTENKVEAPPEKPEEKPVVSDEPRLRADKKRWNEAMRFAEMLTYCRVHNSKTERQFIEKYIRPVGVTFDKKGNMYKRIGTAPVLWSSHVDTVHTKKGFQKIVYWPDKTSGDTFLGLDREMTSACLGGDDTTGVWLMIEMIRRKVPGLYIFHRGEESGGIGSRWIAEHGKEALKDIKFAIAFDRKDTSSIITFQRSTRCCSDEFAKSLAEQLGMDHKCDETGMWTDTAAYVDLIAECTNVSSGYFDAHNKNESVNVDYLLRLRDAICKIDVTKLVEKRKPGENDRKSYVYSGGDYYGDAYWSSYHSSRRDATLTRPRYQSWRSYFTAVELNDYFGKNKWQQWFDWDQGTSFWKPKPGADIPKEPQVEEKKDYGVVKGWSKMPDLFNDGSSRDLAKVARMIRDNAFIIADWMESQGYGPYEVAEYINMHGGYVDEPKSYIPY